MDLSFTWLGLLEVRNRWNGWFVTLFRSSHSGMISIHPVSHRNVTVNRHVCYAIDPRTFSDTMAKIQVTEIEQTLKTVVKRCIPSSAFHSVSWQIILYFHCESTVWPSVIVASWDQFYAANFFQARLQCPLYFGENCHSTEIVNINICSDTSFGFWSQNLLDCIYIIETVQLRLIRTFESSHFRIA